MSSRPLDEWKCSCAHAPCRHDARRFIREIDALEAEVKRLKLRPSVENCQIERAEGNGGCGACALCCKEATDERDQARVEVKRLKSQLSDESNFASGEQARAEKAEAAVAQFREALEAEAKADAEACSTGCRCNSTRFGEDAECRACDLGIAARALRQAVLATGAGKDYVPRAELEKAEAAATKMREVLEAFVSYEPPEIVKDDFAYDRLLANIHKAARVGLTIDAGKNFVPRAELEKAQAAAAQMRDALDALYSFPGVRDRLAPIESLGSVAARVEAALATEAGLGWVQDRSYQCLFCERPLHAAKLEDHLLHGFCHKFGGGWLPPEKGAKVREALAHELPYLRAGQLWTQERTARLEAALALLEGVK